MLSAFAVLCVLHAVVANDVLSIKHTQKVEAQTVVVPFDAKPRSDQTTGMMFNVTVNGVQQLVTLSLTGGNTVGYQKDLNVNYNSSECFIASYDKALQCPFNATIQVGNVTLDHYVTQVIVNSTNATMPDVEGSLSFVNGGNSILTVNSPLNGQGFPSFPQSLFDAGKISQPTASFYFSPNGTTGYIVLGDPEAEQFSDIDYSTKTVLPHRAEILTFNQSYFLVNEQFFTIPLDGIQVGNETIITQQRDVPATLGTQLTPRQVTVTFEEAYDEIILSQNDSTLLVSKLFGDAAIPASGDDLEIGVGGWVVPCDYKTPESWIILGGTKFPMAAENWISAPNPGMVTNGTCFSSVVYSPDIPIHVLGLSFLSTVYSTFHMDSQTVVFYARKQ